MESILGEQVTRLFKFLPIAWFYMLTGLLEWFIPGRWYAKHVDQDIVLITGGGSGLGKAIALEYAKLGSSLILWDINEAGLKETQQLVEQEYTENKEAIGCRECLIYRVDVSDREEVKKFAEQVHSDLNKSNASNQEERYVSVLVNNAGIYHGLLLQDLKDEQIERIFKINILAHFWTVRAFLPLMIKHEKGHIVEIASMGGICGLLKQVDYCATKFATVGFEESLSIELDHLGLANKVHTTAVCPLFFSSNLFTGFNTSVSSLMSAEFVARETVMAMRCNQSRILLPKLRAYLFYLSKTYLPRPALIAFNKAISMDLGIQDIKGKANTKN